MLKIYFKLTMIFTFLIIFTVFAYCQDSMPSVKDLTGEILSFDINNFGIKMGSATLEFKGPTTINNKNALLIIFTAHALNFFDEEKIYVDPTTFNPIIVNRDLNIFGKKEKISEDYLSEQGMIKIVKMADNNTEDLSIEKEGKIDNIYGFIYRYRLQGDFKTGDENMLNLPTKDVKIKLIKNTTIKAAGKKHEAYFMQSDPKKYNIWLSKDEKKTPLRIDGAVGFGKTSMILREEK